MKDKLLFKNESGNELYLYKQRLKISESYNEKCCVGIAPCRDCIPYMLLAYIDSTTGEQISSTISDYTNKDETYHKVDYQFLISPVIYNLTTCNSREHLYEIFKFPDEGKLSDIDTLFKNIYYNGLEYSNIIEINDTLVESCFINRVWLKKDIGLIKFWRGNEVWSLVPEN